MLRRMVFVLLLMSACGPSTSGSNSNWVKCATSSDCSALGAGASCLNGACAASTSSESDATTLPACTWSATLDATDAAVDGSCRAARMFLTCTSDAGDGADCLSDNSMECGPNLSPDVSFVCHDECGPQEYGLECGGPPREPPPDPPVQSDPPAGCRGIAFTPGGVAFYCCPCGQ